MERLRLLFKEAVPDAQESFSYQMPSFKLNGMLAYYAVFSNHYSVFFSPDILDHFRERLHDFSLSKSAIQIPFDAEFPEDVLVDMIRLAALRNNEKLAMKKKRNKSVLVSGFIQQE